MAISTELWDKIKEYQTKGYTPDEIVQGLSTSENYPDIAEKVKDCPAKHTIKKCKVKITLLSKSGRGKKKTI